ncbi:hypothetical protein AOC21_09595 [Polynucleobacter sp. VK25]|uniref:hypothetical protein n=1 Tax=Polynucleobacter sp. VK25 TaxID=1758398 RepID=UPI001BFE80C9|nr:hypothetical protein [Polynucleobacter sp. VK25]QWD68267.1 hypothetical protein AOC21_09595 [Polynucleobacter sp. VK25]
MNSNIVNTQQPNELVINSPEVIGYADTFKTYFIKTAENILEMAKVVFTAKEKLGKNQFREFSYLIGFDPTSSTLKKLQGIGKNYEVLSKNISALPANWTTLYEIAQLPEDKFIAAIDKGVITPNVLGRDVKALTDNASAPKASGSKAPNGTNEDKDSGYRLTVRLSSSPDKKTIDKLRKIIAECRLIQSAEVECTSLEEFLKPEVIEAEAVAA